MIQATFAQSGFPELYEQWLVQPLFEPWVDVLFDRVRLSPGERVLDVACGTGIVARLARPRVGESGRVVGVDVSPLMLAVARRVAPEVEWREGNASALPVEGGEAFDAVFCQQGLQFFPDQPAALREMRRVLAPGGRVALATWRPLDDVPFLLALHRVAEGHLGPVVDRRHALGDDGALRALLESADFRQVGVETVSRRLRFSDPAMFLRLNATALVGMRHPPNTIAEDERARLVSEIARESRTVLAPFEENGAVAFQMAANIATGVC